MVEVFLKLDSGDGHTAGPVVRPHVQHLGHFYHSFWDEPLGEVLGGGGGGGGGGVCVVWCVWCVCVCMYVRA